MNVKNPGFRETESGPMRVPAPTQECISAENLSAELDGEYEFTSADRFHLEHCSRCRGLYESYRVIDDAVTRSLMVNCPRAASYRIRRKVNRRLDMEAPLHTHAHIRFSALAARVAAAVVIAAMAGYLIFIDNPYSDDLSGQPELPPVTAASPAPSAVSASEGTAGVLPGSVEISNLRLAATGEADPVRFLESAASPVKAEHVAVIPEEVKHVWIFDPAWKSERVEKIFRSGLEKAGIALKDVQLSWSDADGLRAHMRLTRSQTVELTRFLTLQNLQLISPVQPQPEQHLFAGRGDEPVVYEAVFVPGSNDFSSK